METNHLIKSCKCGNKLLVTETIYSDKQIDWEMQCEDDTCYIGPNPRRTWPNSVMCTHCRRRHNLDLFKNLEKVSTP